MITQGSKVAIVCCSNAIQQTDQNKIQLLQDTLSELGLVPVLSEYIYDNGVGYSGSGQERAKSLMNFYKDEEIKAIFDISGGDMANEILPYLDFESIAKSEKIFWGYSDLTTIINAIYAQTGKISVLYQVRNLIYEDSKNQLANFIDTVFHGGKKLFSFDYEFLQGERLQGVIVGGNIRCLLKLAGTPYWPDMHGKILLLEALSGTVPQMITYFSQLRQIGVFEKINGILLGTFTQMEKEGVLPAVTDLVKQYVENDIPIAKTIEIGHGVNSKGIVIGDTIYLKK